MFFVHDRVYASYDDGIWAYSQGDCAMLGNLR